MGSVFCPNSANPPKSCKFNQNDDHTPSPTEKTEIIPSPTTVNNVSQLLLSWHSTQTLKTHILKFAKTLSVSPNNQFLYNDYKHK